METKIPTIEEMTITLFWNKEMVSNIKYRLEIKEDNINNSSVFILKSDNKEDKNILLNREKLSFVPIWFAHKWQSSYDSLKEWFNISSSYYRFGSDNKIVLFNKDKNNNLINKLEFDNEKDLFEKLNTLE